MDALELIEQNMDAARILEHYRFEGVKEGNKFSRCRCKLHGSNNDTSFVINNESGLWTCHTNCGSGSIYMLVQQLENIPFKQAVYKVAEILGISLDNATLDVNSVAYLREAKRFMQLAKNFNSASELVPYELPVETRAVSKYRAFSSDTLHHFGLRYVKEIELESDKGGTYVLKDRLALPVTFKGVQLGFALRKIREQDFPKWSNQPKGLPTREILYNYDSLNGEDNVVICEGFFDVWAFHEIGITAVSTFGAHLTDNQMKLLLRTGCTSVTIAFDGDQAGREATEKVIKKLKGKVDVYHVRLDTGTDCEGITREELKRKYEERVRSA